MHFTRQKQAELLEAAKLATDSTGWARDAVAFAALREGSPTPRAVGVFQRFTGTEAEFHLAVDGRPSPDLVKGFLAVAFHPRALNLTRVWTQISDDRVATQVAALKCGFRFEYRKRGGLEGAKDAIFLSMMREASHPAPARQQNDEEEVLQE